MMQHENSLANIGFDEAENEPSNVCMKWGIPPSSVDRFHRYFLVTTAQAKQDLAMLSGAREILTEFMAALEEWEETHESVLKEAHEQDALEVVRSAQRLFNATQGWWVRAGRQAGSFSAVSMPTFASQYSLE